MQVGKMAFQAGFVTKQINIQGHTLAEIEKRLGFHKGRLRNGAYFLVAEELPSNSGFLFAGYTQVADHRTAKIYGNINDPKDPGGDIKKRNVKRTWSLHGSARLVKVVPVIKHNEHMNLDKQYMPGSGIPQWKLIKPVRFRVESFVSNYPSGRFIPSQGFYHAIGTQNTESIYFGSKVSAEFRAEAQRVAQSVDIDVNYLMTIMAFETAGSFSPSQKNLNGSSGTGLIQFMSFTATHLNTTTEKLSKMTAVEQLKYVEKYFMDYKGKLKTLEDTYMAVLYPKAIGQSLDYVLFTKGSLAYTQNEKLDADKDGKITKKEVSAKINAKYLEGAKLKN